MPINIEAIFKQMFPHAEFNPASKTPFTDEMRKSLISSTNENGKPVDQFGAPVTPNTKTGLEKMEKVVMDPNVAKIRPLASGASKIIYADGKTEDVSADKGGKYLYYYSPDFTGAIPVHGDPDSATISFADGTSVNALSPESEKTSGNFFESGDIGLAVIAAAAIAMTYGGATAGMSAGGGGGSVIAPGAAVPGGGTALGSIATGEAATTAAGLSAGTGATAAGTAATLAPGTSLPEGVGAFGLEAGTVAGDAAIMEGATLGAGLPPGGAALPTLGQVGTVASAASTAAKALPGGADAAAAADAASKTMSAADVAKKLGKAVGSLTAQDWILAGAITAGMTSGGGDAVTTTETNFDPAASAAVTSVAERQQQIADEQWQMYKEFFKDYEVAAVQANKDLLPFISASAKAQLELQTSNAIAERPVAEKFYQEALGGVDVGQRTDQAGTEVVNAMKLGERSRRREASRYGIDPGSTAFGNAVNLGAIETAKGVAGARTTAKTAAEAENFGRLGLAVGKANAPVNTVSNADPLQEATNTYSGAASTYSSLANRVLSSTRTTPEAGPTDFLGKVAGYGIGQYLSRI